MNAAQLMREMQLRQITLNPIGDRLQCTAPKGAVTAEIHQAITKHKAAIIEFLAHNIQDQLPEIHPVTRGDSLPLSFAQQRLWFLDQLRPGDTSYNIPAALRVIGDLDMAAFAFAVNEIVRRHEALRTTFVVRNGAATQVIAPALEIATPIIDLSALECELREAEALRLANEEARRPFDLAVGPLMRVTTLDLGARPSSGERERIVMFTLHHIVSDDWSSDIFVREFIAFYEAVVAGRPSPLPDLAIQYADYAAWQREWLQGEVLERQLAYWRNNLLGALSTLDLPTNRLRSTTQDHAGANYHFTVSKDIAERLASLGRREGATLFVTLLTAFQLLLSRYSGQYDISVGTPVANRRRLELEGLIGFFVNTLVMRTDLSGDPSFLALLTRVRETVLSAQEHQDLPFERLVEDLQPTRDMSRETMFQAWFVLTNAQPTEMSTLSSLRVEAFTSDNGRAHFDLKLSLVETALEIKGAFNYATALFDARTIERMAHHYCALLEAIAADPERRLSELDMLDASERHRLLIEWNDTAADYPKDRLLHQLFEEQAARAPEAVAIVFEGDELSYGELNEKANRLAHRLCALGVGPETIVGLCVERSFDMIIALLGVLKAGGAYLPIDPDYPKDRIAFMIDDAAPLLVLAQEHLRDRLPAAIETLRLDADWENISKESAANPDPRATPQNLAYVIYTSGSTGKPKGVGVVHQGVVRLLKNQHYVRFDNPRETVLHCAPLAFDASTFEIWGPLLNQARLIIAPPNILSALDDLGRVVKEYRVTTLWLTAALFDTMIDGCLQDLSNVDVLITGGDVVSPRHARIFCDAFPSNILINGYGPTENTTFSTFYVISQSAKQGPLPIGKPIANSQTFVLDRCLHTVPAGVSGELYIGGAGLARGYIGRPDLTAERFLPNPFSETGERLYRTGDLARYRSDGNIEFLGRIDHQVKIRGFRIELGEIEAALARLPHIREAVVLAREDMSGDKRLVAYVTGRNSVNLVAEELRDALARELPDFMLPSAFIVLDALPLTSNGKLDRGALPAPDLDAQVNRTYVGPRTVKEYVLAREFCAILKMERVGIHDNFFRLGGDSLSGVKLVDRIRRIICSDLPVTAIFQAPTIAQLADWISDADHHTPSPLVTIRRGDTTVLSPLYCIHPGGGSIIRYQPLADAMSGPRAVYGIQSRSLIDPNHFNNSIDEMAKDYVDLLRQNQSQGPYLLLGWSLGGHIAVKMTEVLEQNGQTVAFLGILDTTFEAGEASNHEAARQSKLTALDHLAIFAAIEGIEIEDRLSRSDREHLLEISSKFCGKELYTYSAIWGQERGFWANISPQLMDFLYTDKEASLKLLKDLVLNPIQAPIHIWWAKRTFEKLWSAPCDWGEITSGTVYTEVVGGEHDTIVRDPLLHAQIIRILDNLKI